MKRIFSLLISLVMTIATVHVNAFAERPISASILDNAPISTEITENCKRTVPEESRVVMTYGTFDLLHYGHINFFETRKPSVTIWL